MLRRLTMAIKWFYHIYKRHDLAYDLSMFAKNETIIYDIACGRWINYKFRIAAEFTIKLDQDAEYLLRCFVLSQDDTLKKALETASPTRFTPRQELYIVDQMIRHCDEARNQGMVMTRYLYKHGVKKQVISKNWSET